MDEMARHPISWYTHTYVRTQRGHKEKVLNRIPGCRNREDALQWWVHARPSISGAIVVTIPRVCAPVETVIAMVIVSTVTLHQSRQANSVMHTCDHVFVPSIKIIIQ